MLRWCAWSPMPDMAVMVVGRIDQPIMGGWVCFLRSFVLAGIMSQHSMHVVVVGVGNRRGLKLLSMFWRRTRLGKVGS